MKSRVEEDNISKEFYIFTERASDCSRKRKEIIRKYLPVVMEEKEFSGKVVKQIQEIVSNNVPKRIYV